MAIESMMNNKELAESLRKVASVFERVPEYCSIRKGEPIDSELQVGAAAMLIYIRDCFTISNKDIYTRDEILVILNLIQNDQYFFSLDLVTLMDKEN